MNWGVLAKGIFPGMAWLAQKQSLVSVEKQLFELQMLQCEQSGLQSWPLHMMGEGRTNWKENKTIKKIRIFDIFFANYW